MPKSKKRAKSGRPQQRRTSPEMELMAVLRDGVDSPEPVDRAVEVGTVFRDADELLVGVTVPGGHPLTAVVRIDNELGAVATDGYVAQAPLAAVVELLAP